MFTILNDKSDYTLAQYLVIKRLLIKIENVMKNNNIYYFTFDYEYFSIDEFFIIINWSCYYQIQDCFSNDIKSTYKAFDDNFNDIKEKNKKNKNIIDCLQKNYCKDYIWKDTNTDSYSVDIPIFDYDNQQYWHKYICAWRIQMTWNNYSMKKKLYQSINYKYNYMISNNIYNFFFFTKHQLH